MCSFIQQDLTKWHWNTHTLMAKLKEKRIQKVRVILIFSYDTPAKELSSDYDLVISCSAMPIACFLIQHAWNMRVLSVLNLSETWEHGHVIFMSFDDAKHLNGAYRKFKCNQLKHLLLLHLKWIVEMICSRRC